MARKPARFPARTSRKTTYDGKETGTVSGPDIAKGNNSLAPGRGTRLPARAAQPAFERGSQSQPNSTYPKAPAQSGGQPPLGVPCALLPGGSQIGKGKSAGSIADASFGNVAGDRFKPANGWAKDTKLETRFNEQQR